MSTIHCTSMHQFLTVISGLVENGVRFVADADTFTINISNGVY